MDQGHLVLAIFLAPVWCYLLWALVMFLRQPATDIAEQVATLVLLLIILAGIWLYAGATMDPNSLAHTWECDIPGGQRPALCE